MIRQSKFAACTETRKDVGWDCGSDCRHVVRLSLPSSPINSVWSTFNATHSVNRCSEEETWYLRLFMTSFVSGGLRAVFPCRVFVGAHLHLHTFSAHLCCAFCCQAELDVSSVRSVLHIHPADVVVQDVCNVCCVKAFRLVEYVMYRLRGIHVLSCGRIYGVVSSSVNVVPVCPCVFGTFSGEESAREQTEHMHVTIPQQQSWYRAKTLCGIFGG